MGRHARSGAAVRCRGGRPLATPPLATQWMAGLLAVLWCSAAAAAPVPKADVKTRPINPAELKDTLDGIVDTQRALTAALAQVREQLAATQQADGEWREQVRAEQQASRLVVDQTLEQVEGMRKEVWGLYVESSGLKSDIAQAGKQVEGLDESLGSFRLSAGIVVAAVIVLQFALVGLTFRGRG